jgi:hypothetical protein
MPNAGLNSIEQLRDQLYALQQLVLAQCVALGTADRPALDATLLIAAGQADALIANGRPIAGQRLALLVDEVRKCLD